MGGDGAGCVLAARHSENSNTRGSLIEAGRNFSAVITLGLDIGRLVWDDDALAECIRASVAGVRHASGTCGMGSQDDPDAVTDGAGRVYKVEGLRVCDASLMPAIPRANTNTPTIMMAERIADLVKAGRRARGGRETPPISPRPTMVVPPERIELSTSPFIPATAFAAPSGSAGGFVVWTIP